MSGPRAAAYPPAFDDEQWLRGAALIDGAFAAAEALNRQLLAQRGTAGSESSQTSRAADPQRDIVAVASPVPEHAATSIPPTARGRAQVAAAGGPRQSSTARAASPATAAALVEQGD